LRLRLIYVVTRCTFTRARYVYVCGLVWLVVYGWFTVAFYVWLVYGLRLFTLRLRLIPVGYVVTFGLRLRLLVYVYGYVVVGYIGLLPVYVYVGCGYTVVYVAVHTGCFGYTHGWLRFTFTFTLRFTVVVTHMFTFTFAVGWFTLGYVYGYTRLLLPTFGLRLVGCAVGCWLRFVWLRLVCYVVLFVYRGWLVTVTFGCHVYGWLRCCHVHCCTVVYDLHTLRLGYVYVDLRFAVVTVCGLRLVYVYVPRWLHIAVYVYVTVGYGWLVVGWFTFAFGCVAYTVGWLLCRYFGYVYVYVYTRLPLILVAVGCCV